VARAVARAHAALALSQEGRVTGRRTARGSVGPALLAALALAVAAVWVLPYLFMVSTSFKTLPELLAAPLAPLPRALDFGAYREVRSRVPVGRYLVTTALVALAISGLQIALALPAGYALAKLRFRARPLAFLFVVSC